MNIAIDVNGGDSEARVIAGIKLAIKLGFALPEELTLLGTADAIAAVRKCKELRNLDSQACQEKIGMGEKISVNMARKDCSLVRGMRGLRDGRYNSFVSAGNSAAITFLGTFMLGRIAHGLFPAIAVPMPNIFGQCLLLDIGANANATPKNLLQNAQMGSIYAGIYRNILKPRVGLINIGEEMGKGDKVVHSAYELLADSDLNFIGYIEGKDIFLGAVDVAVTDGFTGNTVLKSNEGVVKMITSAIQEEFKKHHLSYAALPFLIIAYPFLLPMIKGLKKRFDYEETGGAILLGVDGIVIIAHGRSQPLAIANAIRRAKVEVEAGIIEAIKLGIKKNNAP